MTEKIKSIKVPGPKGHILFGSALEVKKDVLGYLLKNMHEYKTISKVRLGPRTYINLFEPDYIQQVFQGNQRNYKKGRDIENLRFLLGEGLLTSEGEYWLSQRRLIQPVFHKKRLGLLIHKMVSSTETILNNWETFRNNEAIDIHKEMLQLALDVISNTMFSMDVKSEFSKVSSALDILLAGIFAKARSLLNLPFWIPLAGNLKLKEQRQILYDTIEMMIQRRRSSSEKFDDLLNMLMEVEDADTTEKMTNRQLRDELLTIFLAGHETTANALTFTIWLLSEHPDEWQKVKEETTRVLGNGPPTAENLRQLTYLLQVIQEGMRLYPPAWGITREALADDEIGGHDIKKGDNFVIAPWAVHRNPEFWPEPDKFKPERFNPELSKGRHKYCYIPFGGGPRLCIGNNFALMEMQVVISMLVQRYTLKHLTSHKVELEPLVTLRPKNGMLMQVF